eukprot:m.180719 g.180719  ORF g.180719 m.180719 type:complete len:233 (+) comp18431_c0_seq5:251-949(+)
MPSPSRNGGGNLSKGTQSLLKDMMQKSGLTASQQKRLMAQASEGKSLPKTCNPTSSAPVKPRQGDVREGRTSSSGPINPRTYVGGKRAQKNIPTVKRDEMPRQTMNSIDRQEEKEMMADIMAYGARQANTRRALRQAAKRGDLVPRESRGDSDVGCHTDEFEIICREIDERRDYIDQMSKASGMNAAERAVIDAEVSQRIRRLEVIDRARNDSLNALEAKAVRSGAQTARLR